MVLINFNNFKLYPEFKRSPEGVGFVCQPKLMKTALKLRESLFLNSILTNADVWYGLSDKQVCQVEVVDRLLLRKFLNTPISTPIEGIQLELGTFSVGTIIKAR